MTISEQIRTIIAETLDVSPSIITESSSTETVDAWDSLAQVNLMIAIEQTFDIVLDVEDFLKLNSVVAITDFLVKSSEL